MISAHLNEPTIELAHEKYLTRWHLDSVQNAWRNGKGQARKPTLAQYRKRFGDAYEARQRHLSRTGQGTSATALAVAEREDVIQGLAENLLTILGGNTDEPEDTILGSEPADEIEQALAVGNEPLSRVLSILGKQKAPQKAEAPAAPEQKFVKPENFDELPRSGQVYFFLHRAQENGDGFAIVPLKRGVAAEAISQIKDDGRSYESVASDLVKAR